MRQNTRFWTPAADYRTRDKQTPAPADAFVPAQPERKIFNIRHRWHQPSLQQAQHNQPQNLHYVKAHLLVLLPTQLLLATVRATIKPFARDVTVFKSSAPSTSPLVLLTLTEGWKYRYWLRCLAEILIWCDCQWNYSFFIIWMTYLGAGLSVCIIEYYLNTCIEQRHIVIIIRLMRICISDGASLHTVLIG